MNTLVQGFSDISSSEGKLWRYSRICKLFEPKKSYLRSNIKEEIRKNIDGVKHDNSIQRHLTILEKLHILQDKEGTYVLSSHGKALALLLEDSLTTSLSPKEQIFYFKSFLLSNASQQLINLIETILSSSHGHRKDIIVSYFDTDFAKNLWNRNTVLKNLDKLKQTNRIPSFLENKFRCMEMWLEDIGLLMRKKDVLYLSAGAGKISPFLKSHNHGIKESIYELAGLALFGTFKKYNFKNYRKKFLDLLYTAHKALRTTDGISDIRAITDFCCINLLEQGFKMEEKDFNNIIKELWSEGKVKSVMLGRDGKASYLELTNTT